MKVQDTRALAKAAPRTLAIDIGGTRLKAGVLDAAGAMAEGPVRVDTPHPAPPESVVDALAGLAAQLGPFDRVSAGFPGVVKRGVVLTAPNLGTEAWAQFPLSERLAARFGRPVRLLNDASVQGLGVIEGRGLECVITLGTGVGFALFENGRLAPHLELGQHPVRKGHTYDGYLGTEALKTEGPKRWNRRLGRALGYWQTLVCPDVLLIGGGNSRHIDFDLPDWARVVSNGAGITGGVRLWDGTMDDVFA